MKRYLIPFWLFPLLIIETVILWPFTFVSQNARDAWEFGIYPIWRTIYEILWWRRIPLIILALAVTGCAANDGSNFMAAAVQQQNRPIDREEREGLSTAGAEIVSCGDPAPDPKLAPCATVWRTCKRRDGKTVVAIMPNDPVRCIQTDDVCQ